MVTAVASVHLCLYGGSHSSYSNKIPRHKSNLMSGCIIKLTQTALQKATDTCPLLRLMANEKSLGVTLTQ